MFSLQHPLAPQLSIRPEIRLVGEEYLGPVRLASPDRAAYSTTNASRLVSFALTNSFLGRFRTYPNRCRTCPRADEG